jgi:hypothetical protein
VRFTYQAVERIPKQLESGVVYHTEEFELAALLCACGCGHRVMLLVPDSHKVWSQDGMATIRPSIAVCDAPCKSHYYMTAGRIECLPGFTEASAASLMQAQIARHAVSDAKQLSWRSRFKLAIANALNKLRSILRI